MTRRNKKIAIVTIFTSVALSVAAILVYAFLIRNHSSVANKEGVDKPAFSFDQSKAPGWWSSGNNWPDISEFSGGQITEAELPIADINVIKGTKDTPGECFVMAFYQKGTIDIAASLKQRESGMTMGEKNPSILTKVGEIKQKIETLEGSKDYTLYQYDLNKEQVQKGNEFGFIPLSAGYIEVRGICPTVDQLPSTVAPLSALTLNP